MPPLPPGSTIGILGGGQLGRMLALGAARLGLKCHIYCPEPDAPAFDVAATRTIAPYDDIAALKRFATSCQAVTFEFENIPADALGAVSALTRLSPGVYSLQKTQDRLVEKTLLRELNIDVAPFAPVDNFAMLQDAVDKIGRPAILKTRRFGYDGKGQWRIDAGTNLEDAYAALNGAQDAAQVDSQIESQIESLAILEAFVPFQKEVSVVLTRAENDEIAIYDLAENRHEDHILKETVVPALVPASIFSLARQMAGDIARELGHVGTLAVECFYMGENAPAPLLVNEIAPRVHNSGHWTVDACVVSQFENHIRAVAGWPLGQAARHSDAIMTNLIGDEADDWQSLAEADVAVHLYGKSESRPGRKMGHKTKIAPRRA